MVSRAILADLAKTPVVSVHFEQTSPALSTLPRDGRIPYSPFTAAGCLMDPPVSVPMLKSSQR